MVTHLGQDILECEVKRALGSITMNKASGGDGIPAELFKILKDDNVKVLDSIHQQIWKTQQRPQDWKRSVCFPSNPKEGRCQSMFKTTGQLNSFHMLARLCSNSSRQATAVCEPRTSRCISWVLKRQRNQRSNCQYTMDRGESKGFPEEHLILFHWLR